MEGLMAHAGSEKLTREQLGVILPPEPTDTFKPISHATLVEQVIEGLSFRHINVVRDEYAVSEDGMKLFGVMDLEAGMDGARYSLGIRNANDKSMRLGLTVGYRVFVCDNMAFHGDFTPVLAKHSKHFVLADAIDIGLGRMQRNFDPMRKQIEGWQAKQLTDGSAKNIIYDAFLDDDLALPRHLACAPSITPISTRSIRSLLPGPSGASPTPLRRRSRNWTPFRSSKRPRSSANSSPRSTERRRYVLATASARRPLCPALLRLLPPLRGSKANHHHRPNAKAKEVT
jgi:hypothetical protein